MRQNSGMLMYSSVGSHLKDHVQVFEVSVAWHSKVNPIDTAAQVSPVVLEAVSFINGACIILE